MEEVLKMKNKKGQVMNGIQLLFTALAGMVIVAAVVFLIIANVAANAQVAADGNASAAVATIQGAAATIPGWVPLVVIATIGGLILLLVRVFR